MLKNHPKPSAKNESGEYATFSMALQKVLTVSHTELQARLSADKQAKQNGKKRVSGRASRAKD